MADDRQQLASAAFELGDWLIEPALNRATRDGESIAIENKSMDVLVFLATCQGDVVSADEVIAAVWNNQPMGDNPVYKCIANLRKALGDSASSPEYIETIPRRGYRLVADVSILGRTKSPATNTSRTSRRHVLVFIGVAVASLLAFYWLEIRQPSPGDPGPDLGEGSKSIAVLSFENLSGDPDDDFFCRGIAEELLNNLAQVRALRVVARQSAFSFADQQVDLSEFAARLGVQYLLTGSVRRDGELLRVTARLLSADGLLIWSENYDRTIDSVFVMQDDIAAAVVEGLAVNVTDDSSRRTGSAENVEAYTAYLLGREYLNSTATGSRAKAVAAFEKAIRLDAEYAAPYAGLAISYLATPLPTESGIRRAESLIETALRLDPNLAEGHAAAGLFAMNFGLSPDHDAAIVHLRRALELNPSLIRARNWLSTSLRMKGDHPGALRVLEEAVAIDPLNTGLSLNLGRAYMGDAQFDTARRQMARVLDFPDVPAYAWAWLSDLEGHVGDFVAALEWLKKASATPSFRDPETAWEAGIIAASYANLGLFDAANRWLAEMRLPQGSPWRLNYYVSVLSRQPNFAELAKEVDDYRAYSAEDAGAYVWTASMIGSHLVQIGKYEEAIVELAPVFEDGIPIYNGPGGSIEILVPLQALCLAYQRTGDTERANELLHEALGFFQRVRQNRARLPGYILALEAITHSLLGESSTARQRMREAAAAGWRFYYLAKYRPAMAELFNDPEMADVWADMLREVERQQAIVLEDESLQPFPVTTAAPSLSQ